MHVCECLCLSVTIPLVYKGRGHVKPFAFSPQRVVGLVNMKSWPITKKKIRYKYCFRCNRKREKQNHGSTWTPLYT